MRPSGRTGVILAAGFGSRLEGVSSETALKPLTPVGGKPLLLRTIAGLSEAGCSKVIVVLGHGADAVEGAVRAAYRGDVPLSFVLNPRYDLSNGVSLLAAADLIEGEFILTMADHVFGDEVYDLAREHRPPSGGAMLLVDFDIDGVFDLDDATKVRQEGGRIAAIGKQIDQFDCIDTGLFVCTPGLIDAIRDVFEDRGDASLSDGVTRLAAQNKMTVMDIGDGFWQDVDTPEMLAEAERRLAERQRITMKS